VIQIQHKESVMAVKLGKGEVPSGSTPADFKCYGPPATVDTEFSQARIADLGCFSQEDVDSNKYYHVCMCTHKTSNKWYVYVEYGRQGAGKPQYQWFECANEADARKAFEERCKEKNTSRGEWSNVAGVKMFVPKAGKDLYRVRQLAKRSYGLPDAQSITTESAVPVKSSTKKSGYRCDPQTTQLMRDLLGGAVSYTRSSLQGGTIPVQAAIDEGRQFLELAKKRISILGNDFDTQVKDQELKQITYALYSRIPKLKPLHCPEADWILSQTNIFGWEQDLGAFETALSAGSTDHIAVDDPMEGLPVDMEWIDPKTQLGAWLYGWWPTATKNKHHNVGALKIKNLWRINRHGDDEVFDKELAIVAKEVGKKTIADRPIHQNKERPDLNGNRQDMFWNTNVGLLFHGTRTVNVPGIIKTNLRLPAQLTGVIINAAMFGGGLYWADDFKKSVGYTSTPNALYSSYNSGGVKGRHAFMFAADVILGVPHAAPQAKGFTSAPKGCHSVYGKAGYSQGWNGALLCNEWIVYQGGRNVLRYLIEFAT